MKEFLTRCSPPPAPSSVTGLLVLCRVPRKLYSVRYGAHPSIECKNPNRAMHTEYIQRYDRGSAAE